LTSKEKEGTSKKKETRRGEKEKRKKKTEEYVSLFTYHIFGGGRIDRKKKKGVSKEIKREEGKRAQRACCFSVDAFYLMFRSKGKGDSKRRERR